MKGSRSGALVTAGAFLALAGACRESQPNVTHPDSSSNAMSLRLAAHSMLADGASTLLLEATIPKSLRDSHRSVYFLISDGTLQPSGEKSGRVYADGAGVAATLVRSGTSEGLIIVQAATGDTVVQDSVRMVRAWPESIEIEPDEFLVSGTATVTVSARLFRNLGVPTTGARVEFAAEMNGARVGQFGIPSQSDEEGRVSVRFSPQLPGGLGRIQLIARVNIDPARVISDTVVLQLVPPPNTPGP